MHSIETVETSSQRRQLYVPTCSRLRCDAELSTSARCAVCLIRLKLHVSRYCRLRCNRNEKAKGRGKQNWKEEEETYICDKIMIRILVFLQLQVFLAKNYSLCLFVTKKPIPLHSRKKEVNSMIQSTLINLAVLHIIRVVVISSKAWERLCMCNRT